MNDVLGDALRAAASGAALAYPLVFAAGVATSAGPCTAPRYIAVAALAHATQRPWRIVGGFIAGLAATYVMLGLALSSMTALWSGSRWLYAALACGLAAGGLAVLLRGGRDVCPEHRAPARSGNLSGAFLLGASSGVVVSPCCTPAIAAIAGMTTMGGRAIEGSLLLATFACGHALPLAAVAALGTRLSGFVSRFGGSHASATISGALMLALAAYYGTLA